MKKQLRKVSFKNSKRMIAVVLFIVILTGLLSINVFANYLNIFNEKTYTACVGETFSLDMSANITQDPTGSLRFISTAIHKDDSSTADLTIISDSIISTNTSEKGNTRKVTFLANTTGLAIYNTTMNYIVGDRYDAKRYNYRVTYDRYTITVIPSTFNVTFNPNGGECAVSSGKVEFGQPYSYYIQQLPTPTKPGFKFDGWYTAESGGQEITNITKFEDKKDVTLYAHWSAAEYPVYFDANGGSIPADQEEYKYVKYGEPYGDLPTPVRDGYTFRNWYTDPKYGTVVNADTKVTVEGEHVLYAHWSENAAPTPNPTAAPTPKPTNAPTPKPTAAPTAKPTAAPTQRPTAAPTAKPTTAPTPKPTTTPVPKPTTAPTAKPTVAPTAKPTTAPTSKPTAAPTAKPTVAPTPMPTTAPTPNSTAAPTDAPTSTPPAAPTTAPASPPMETTEPSVTAAPTPVPTFAPTAGPTAPPQKYEWVIESYTDGIVSITAPENIPADNVNICIAKYNGADLLEDCEILVINPLPGSGRYRAFKKIEADDAGSLKIMLWDDLRPLADPLEISKYDTQ